MVDMRTCEMSSNGMMLLVSKARKIPNRFASSMRDRSIDDEDHIA
jgi:hypothetical protein